MRSKRTFNTTSTPAFDKQGSLALTTLQLLEKDERSLPEISKQSGLPFYWLRSFKENRVPSPNVNRVQFLYEFLSGKKAI